MTTFAERRYQDRVIRHEYDAAGGFGYTRKAAKVYNRTGSPLTVTDVMCQPLRPDESVAGAYMFALVGEEGYVTALCLYEKGFAVSNLADNASIDTKVLVRGPAIIDKDELPPKDVAGSTFDLDTIATALEGLMPPIISNPEQPVTVTQTL